MACCSQQTSTMCSTGQHSDQGTLLCYPRKLSEGRLLLTRHRWNATDSRHVTLTSVAFILPAAPAPSASFADTTGAHRAGLEQQHRSDTSVKRGPSYVIDMLQIVSLRTYLLTALRLCVLACKSMCSRDSERKTARGAGFQQDPGDEILPLAG